MNIKSVSFLGLGLIGGSIAKALRETYPDIHIYTHAGHEETIEKAHKDGVSDNGVKLELRDLCKSDIVFLCAPVGINSDYLGQIAPLVGPDTIITDVGSVKGDIHIRADELGLSGSFVGGHPMTGSEKIGYDHSSPSLLVNAYYILTAEDEKAKEKLRMLHDFIKPLGPVMLSLTPELHDFATGAISHLPHVVSAALVNTVSANETDDELLKMIAAGGFRDITRISSSSPVMWEHILRANKTEVIKLIDLYTGSLSDFQKALLADDYDSIRDLFSNAKDYRDSLSVKKKGALTPSYSFFCDLFDEAGQIAAVAAILAASGLSIKNIGIVHNREFEEGVLQVEMYDETSLERSIELLKRHNYTIHEKR